MSVLEIGQAAQAILADAIQNVAPGTSVLLGHPDHFNDAITLYLYHLGYLPDAGKHGSTIRRPHLFAIHLMVHLSATGRQDAEATYLGLHDAISNAFYENATVRTLNGTAKTSTLEPMTSAPSSAPYAATEKVGEFRQQWWTLRAEDQWSFDWRD